MTVTLNRKQVEFVRQRDKGHLRLCALTATAAVALGALLGWNAHETSDVRANYIADLPTCKTAEVAE